MRIFSSSLLVAAIAFTALGACNAKIATVLEGSDGGAAAPSGETGGSSTTGAACTVDAECNDNPALSALFGKCQGGRCVCTPESPSQVPFSPRGKCGPAPPECTVGQDQTCNADPAMSSLAGQCLSSAKCKCNVGFEKNFTGKCAPPETDDNHVFPTYVEGLWLIGWSGGLDHFSWVRLVVDPAKARFRSKASENKSVTPYFGCDGDGRWQLTAKPSTVFLYLPDGCSAGGVQQTLTFGTVAGRPSFPKGALLQVNFEHEPNEQALIGFKFRDDACDLDLTTCVDVFSGN